jgi:hypothetical protein
VSVSSETDGQPQRGEPPLFDELRDLRFELPCLYALAPDAGGRTYASAVDDYNIHVAIPSVRTNEIKDLPGQWIVPRMVTLTVPVPLAETLGRSDTLAVEWWRQVCAWLAAWVGEAPGRDRPIQRQVLRADQSVESTSGTMDLYALPRQARASREQLSRAFELAGQRFTPPGEYRMLSQAQEMRDSGDWRGCVIAAASAVEAAMQAVLDTRSPQGGQNATRRPVGLWQRYQLLQGLGVDVGVEESAVRSFKDLRNETVHTGSNPGALQAQEAARTARAILHALSGGTGAPR